jgi:hypothetical protein
MTYAVLKLLILQPKLTMMTKASIQECLVYRHFISKILANIQTVASQFLIIAPVRSGGAAHTKQPSLLLTGFRLLVF